MLKPSDLTKAELLQVVEMLAMETGPYYLDRALGRIRLQRNDAHHERCVKLLVLHTRSLLTTSATGKPATAGISPTCASTTSPRS